jgi:hypothetical protein
MLISKLKNNQWMLSQIHVLEPAIMNMRASGENKKKKKLSFKVQQK